MKADPCNIKTSFVLNSYLSDFLKEKAARLDRSRSWVVRQLLDADAARVIPAWREAEAAEAGGEG